MPFLLPLSFLTIFANWRKLHNAALSAYHDAGVYSRFLRFLQETDLAKPSVLLFINVVFQILTWSISGTGASLQIMCNVFWLSPESRDMSLTFLSTRLSLWKLWASWLCSLKPCWASHSSIATIRIGRPKEWGKTPCTWNKTVSVKILAVFIHSFYHFAFLPQRSKNCSD